MHVDDDVLQLLKSDRNVLLCCIIQLSAKGSGKNIYQKPLVSRFICTLKGQNNAWKIVQVSLKRVQKHFTSILYNFIYIYRKLHGSWCYKIKSYSFFSLCYLKSTWEKWKKKNCLTISNNSMCCSLYCSRFSWESSYPVININKTPNKKLLYCSHFI